MKRESVGSFEVTHSLWKGNKFKIQNKTRGERTTRGGKNGSN